jgi:hypothetical protein
VTRSREKVYNMNTERKPILKRIQMDLPEKSLARLQYLKEKTEASSYADVMKNALRLYDLLISEAEQGNTFQVLTKDGVTKEYIIF